jgi:hypothetical protein
MKEWVNTHIPHSPLSFHQMEQLLYLDTKHQREVFKTPVNCTVRVTATGVKWSTLDTGNYSEPIVFVIVDETLTIPQKPVSI